MKKNVSFREELKEYNNGLLLVVKFKWLLRKIRLISFVNWII